MIRYIITIDGTPYECHLYDAAIDSPQTHSLNHFQQLTHNDSKDTYITRVLYADLCEKLMLNAFDDDNLSSLILQHLFKGQIFYRLAPIQSHARRTTTSLHFTIPLMLLGLVGSALARLRLTHSEKLSEVMLRDTTFLNSGRDVCVLNSSLETMPTYFTGIERTPAIHIKSMLDISEKLLPSEPSILKARMKLAERNLQYQDELKIAKRLFKLWVVDEDILSALIVESFCSIIKSAQDTITALSLYQYETTILEMGGFSLRANVAKSLYLMEMGLIRADQILYSRGRSGFGKLTHSNLFLEDPFYTHIKLKHVVAFIDQHVVNWRIHRVQPFELYPIDQFILKQTPVLDLDMQRLTLFLEEGALGVIHVLYINPFIVKATREFYDRDEDPAHWFVSQKGGIITLYMGWEINRKLIFKEALIRDKNQHLKTVGLDMLHLTSGSLLEGISALFLPSKRMITHLPTDVISVPLTKEQEAFLKRGEFKRFYPDEYNIQDIESSVFLLDENALLPYSIDEQSQEIIASALRPSSRFALQLQYVESKMVLKRIYYAYIDQHLLQCVPLELPKNPLDVKHLLSTHTILLITQNRIIAPFKNEAPLRKLSWKRLISLVMILGSFISLLFQVFRKTDSQFDQGAYENKDRKLKIIPSVKTPRLSHPQINKSTLNDVSTDSITASSVDHKNVDPLIKNVIESMARFRIKKEQMLERLEELNTQKSPDQTTAAQTFDRCLSKLSKKIKTFSQILQSLEDLMNDADIVEFLEKKSILQKESRTYFEKFNEVKHIHFTLVHCATTLDELWESTCIAKDKLRFSPPPSPWHYKKIKTHVLSASSPSVLERPRPVVSETSSHVSEKKLISPSLSSQEREVKAPVTLLAGIKQPISPLLKNPRFLKHHYDLEPAIRVAYFRLTEIQDCLQGLLGTAHLDSPLELLSLNTQPIHHAYYICYFNIVRSVECLLTFTRANEDANGYGLNIHMNDFASFRQLLKSAYFLQDKRLFLEFSRQFSLYFLNPVKSLFKTQTCPFLKRFYLRDTPLYKALEGNSAHSDDGDLLNMIHHQACLLDEIFKNKWIQTEFENYKSDALPVQSLRSSAQCHIMIISDCVGRLSDALRKQLMQRPLGDLFRSMRIIRNYIWHENADELFFSPDGDVPKVSAEEQFTIVKNGHLIAKKIEIIRNNLIMEEQKQSTHSNDLLI